MLNGETPNIKFIVFGLTQPGLEHMFYQNRGMHANHYTTDAIQLVLNFHPYVHMMHLKFILSLFVQMFNSDKYHPETESEIPFFLS
jgi:hypothetical protein